MTEMFRHNIAIVILFAACSSAVKADSPDLFDQAVREVAAESENDMMMAVTSLTGETGLKQLEAYQRDPMGQWPNPQADGDAVLALRFGEHTFHLGIGYHIGEQSSKQLNEFLLKDVFDEAQHLDSDTPKDTKPKTKSGNEDSPQSEVVSSDDENPSVSVTSYQRDDLRTKLLRFVASTGVANTDLDELGWMLDHYRPGPLWLLARTPRLTPFPVREPLFASLDSNHDGEIDKDEAAAISELLMASDRDRNESTSWQEIQRSLANQATSEISAPQHPFDWAWVDSQTNPTKAINVRLNINHSEPSATQSRKHVLTVSSNDSAAQRPNTTLLPEFKRVDCEFEPPVRIYFHGYTDSELTGAAEFQCSLAASFRSNQLWAAMDTNGNGSIGLKERANLLNSIGEFDRDLDQAISVEEIPIVMDLIVCQGSAAIDQEVQSETKSPQAMRTSNPGKPIPAWYASMDGNSDGVISKDEFLGSTTQFSKLDKDNNGWIDLNESE